MTGENPSEDVTVVINQIRRLERGLRLLAREVESSTGASAAQLFVLQQLAAGAPLSLRELSARTFTDPSSVSTVVERLVGAGLVSREAAASDRRRAEVRITSLGRKALAASPPPPAQRLVEAIGALSPTTRHELAAALGRLNRALGFDAGSAKMLFEESGDH